MHVPGIWDGVYHTFLKTTGFIGLNGQWVQLGAAHSTALCKTISNKLHCTHWCSQSKLVVFNMQIRTHAFHIWALLLHLEFTFWWVKVKRKIIKSYFEDGRPSNQSVFRQCVFKWTFISKYLFVIASLKRLSVLYYYLSFMYLYREKILYFFSIYLLWKKKKKTTLFLVHCTEVTFFSSCILEENE